MRRGPHQGTPSFRKAHACLRDVGIMRRVIVVGAGLSGLAAALEIASAGLAVVVLEARTRVGGRATTTAGRYADFGFGPHILLRGGATHRLVAKVARVRLVTTPLLPQHINVVGHGPLRTLRGVRKTAAVRRTLRNGLAGGPETQALRLLAGWGLPMDAPGLAARAEGILMGRGWLLREGWAGLVGRLVATLDEVGVPIETGVKVTEVQAKGVVLSDGRKVEADAVVMATGPGGHPAPLSKEGGLLRASTVDALVQSLPMEGHQGIVDPEQGMAVLRLPEASQERSHLSAIALAREGEDDEARLERLVAWMDLRLAGWSDHVAEDRRQAGIDIAHLGGTDVEVVNGVVHVRTMNGLSDAAIEAGRAAGRAVVARGER